MAIFSVTNVFETSTGQTGCQCHSGLSMRAETVIQPEEKSAFTRSVADGETALYIFTSGTFRLLKGELREQAYHLEKVGDDGIIVRKPRGERYERLGAEFFPRLLDGSAGY